MRHWCVLLPLLVLTSSVAAKRTRPAKPSTPTFWYQVIPRWSDQSDQEWVFLAQPATGKLAGAFVWPKRDENGRPFIKFLRLSGTMEKGQAWLSSPNEMRYRVVLKPPRLPSDRLSLIYLKDGAQFDFRRAQPPPLKGRQWVDVLTMEP